MNSHDARYLARFLAASRIALGLDAHAEAGPDEAQSGAANRQGQPATSCPLTEMRPTAGQREKVFAGLEAYGPVIRARMKAARRAQHQLRTREGATLSGVDSSAGSQRRPLPDRPAAGA